MTFSWYARATVGRARETADEEGRGAAVRSDFEIARNIVVGVGGWRGKSERADGRVLLVAASVTLGANQEPALNTRMRHHSLDQSALSPPSQPRPQRHSPRNNQINMYIAITCVQ